MELREIDLALGDDHIHPHLYTNIDYKYLCLVSGNYLIGYFENIKRGLLFHHSHDGAILYDKPGVNDSHWNRVYQVLETADEAIKRVDLKQANSNTKKHQNSKKTVRTSCGKAILKYKPKLGK